MKSETYVRKIDGQVINYIVTDKLAKCRAVCPLSSRVFTSTAVFSAKNVTTFSFPHL